MNYKDKIIEFCKKNRVSTTEVADALGKSGVLEGLKPINENFYKVGKVRTIFTANNSNFSVHEQIIDVDDGDVVIIFAHNCNERAIIGDLIAKFFQYLLPGPKFLRIFFLKFFSKFSSPSSNVLNITWPTSL